MLTSIVSILTWMVKKYYQNLMGLLAFFWPLLFALLEICGCLLKFSIWIVIFTATVCLNLLGLFLLALISVVGQVRRLFQSEPTPRRRRRQQGNGRRTRSHEIASPAVKNGYSPMNYETVIRTNRGLYTLKGRFSKPKLSCPEYWSPHSYNDYDSSYFTDTISESSFGESWNNVQPRFRQPLL